jgi:alkaline phosphatase D
MQDSVDYVVQLGDYIYEYENGYYGDGTSIGRIPQPDREIYTLYDYRRRHAIYKTDLDLVESHQQYPWIPVWDDHGKIIPLIIRNTKENSTRRPAQLVRK